MHQVAHDEQRLPLAFKMSLSPEPSTCVTFGAAEIALFAGVADFRVRLRINFRRKKLRENYAEKNRFRSFALVKLENFIL
jgi:hypothetical protein